MSPIGLGTDLAISVRGPAAANRHHLNEKRPTDALPMTGIWPPPPPRRLWHVRADGPFGFATSRLPSRNWSVLTARDAFC